MAEETRIYFIGTAGSGKTLACNSFQRYLKSLAKEVTVVNLDPGVIADRTLKYNYILVNEIFEGF